MISFRNKTVDVPLMYDTNGNLQGRYQDKGFVRKEIKRFDKELKQYDKDFILYASMNTTTSQIRDRATEYTLGQLGIAEKYINYNIPPELMREKMGDGAMICAAYGSNIKTEHSFGAKLANFVKPMTDKMAAKFPKLQKFADKVTKAANDGRMPLTAESAAVMKIAFDKKFYRDSRKAGADIDKLRAEYQNACSNLRTMAQFDGVDMNKLDEAYNKKLFNQMQVDETFTDMYKGVMTGDLRLKFEKDPKTKITRFAGFADAKGKLINTWDKLEVREPQTQETLLGDYSQCLSAKLAKYESPKDVNKFLANGEYKNLEKQVMSQSEDDLPAQSAEFEYELTRAKLMAIRDWGKEHNHPWQYLEIPEPYASITGEIGKNYDLQSGDEEIVGKTVDLNKNKSADKSKDIELTDEQKKQALEDISPCFADENSNDEPEFESESEQQAVAKSSSEKLPVVDINNEVNDDEENNDKIVNAVNDIRGNPDDSLIFGDDDDDIDYDSLDVEETKQTPEDETKQTPEDETKQTPEDETKQTPEDETKQTPEDETKQTPEDETKQTPEDETKQTPEDETKQTPEDETKQTPEDETKQTPEDETKQTPEDETKQTPEDETKQTPEGKSDAAENKQTSDNVKKAQEEGKAEIEERQHKADASKTERQVDRVFGQQENQIQNDKVQDIEVQKAVAKGNELQNRLAAAVQILNAKINEVNKTVDGLQSKAQALNTSVQKPYVSFEDISTNNFVEKLDFEDTKNTLGLNGSSIEPIENFVMTEETKNPFDFDMTPDAKDTELASEETTQSTKAPETSDNAPETSNNAPEETSNNAPETSNNAPETSNNAPETSDNAPETSDNAPEAPLSSAALTVTVHRIPNTPVLGRDNERER